MVCNMEAAHSEPPRIALPQRRDVMLPTAGWLAPVQAAVVLVRALSPELDAEAKALERGMDQLASTLERLAPEVASMTGEALSDEFTHVGMLQKMRAFGNDVGGGCAAVKEHLEKVKVLLPGTERLARACAAYERVTAVLIAKTSARLEELAEQAKTDPVMAALLAAEVDEEEADFVDTGPREPVLTLDELRAALAR
jgi:hypothetical protein